MAQAAGWLGRNLERLEAAVSHGLKQQCRAACWHQSKCSCHALGDIGTDAVTELQPFPRQLCSHLFVSLFCVVCRGCLACQVDFAMVSLKKSMKWDEDVYGLEYDLVRHHACWL